MARTRITAAQANGDSAIHAHIAVTRALSCGVVSDLEHRPLGDPFRTGFWTLVHPYPEECVELGVVHRSIASGHAVHLPAPGLASASSAPRSAVRPAADRDLTVPSGMPSISAIWG